MARRRKKQKQLLVIRVVVKLLQQRWVQVGLLAGLGFVICVNLLVSHLGQCHSFFLSPYHLWDKSQALGLYAVHRVSRGWKPSGPTPRRALWRAIGKHKVPARLVFAVAKVESDFMPLRISPTGAMGLMQVMPATARDMNIQDPFHVQENANGGVKYLAFLWRRYQGNMHRIVAAYNAGPGRVPPAGNYRLPPETRRYVRRVMYYARRF